MTTSTTRRRSASTEANAHSKKPRSKGPVADINLPTGVDLDLHHEKYTQATPYNHAVIGGLLSDDLVRSITT